ncbi:hypothetical protein [Isoptericola sp. 178]|uniref:hypothetical protein n=1 Tax=Isoptericola sp. 178 TaxID=3064651 RepID=UPI002713FBD8|nr:hypothetical protein [Isoptericola sp. 178]MDO8143932.1 hypothetical protein [Isoptericola sp. 178]
MLEIQLRYAREVSDPKAFVAEAHFQRPGGREDLVIPGWGVSKALDSHFKYVAVASSGDTVTLSRGKPLLRSVKDFCIRIVSWSGPASECPIEYVDVICRDSRAALDLRFRLSKDLQ